MKCRVMLLGVLMSLLIFGCSGDKQAEYIQHYEDSMKRESEETTEQLFDISDNAKDISDPAALQYFQDLYGLSSLEKQTLFWDDKTLQLSYYFLPDVPFYQIDTARSYVINRFVLGNVNKGNPTPYEHWMMEGGTIRDIPRVSCRVFLGDDLVLQDTYEDKRVRGFYEDFKVNVAARQFDPENEAEIMEVAERYMKDPELVFEKGICDGTQIIHLKSNHVLAPEKMELLIADLSKVDSGSVNYYLVFWGDGNAYYCRYL